MDMCEGSIYQLITRLLEASNTQSDHEVVYYNVNKWVIQLKYTLWFDQTDNCIFVIIVY